MKMASNYQPFPVYDGHSDPNAFIQQFSILSELNTWDETKQKAVIKIFINGKAKTVYDTAITNGGLADIKAVFDCLRKGCGLTKEAIMEKFYDRTLRTGESISVYASKLQDLLKKGAPTMDAEIQSSMIKKQLLKVVPEHLRPIIRLSSNMGGTLESILDSLDGEMPAHDSIISPFKSETLSTIKQEPIENNFTQSSRNYTKQPQRQTTSIQPQRRRFDGQCYYCNQHGHRRSECDKQRADNDAQFSRQNRANNFSQGFSSINRQQQNYQPQFKQGNFNNYNSNSYRNNQYHNQQNATAPSQNNGIHSDIYRNSSGNGSNQNSKTTNSNTVLIEQEQDSFSDFPYSYNLSYGQNNVSDNNTITIVTLGMGNPNHVLLKAKVKVSLFGETIELKALIDSGSSHSFINPAVLTKKSKLKIIKSVFSYTSFISNKKRNRNKKLSMCGDNNKTKHRRLGTQPNCHNF